MKRGVSEKTKKLTLGALLAAMGTVLLLLGALIETLDLTMAALASFFCIFAVIELGGAYPWLIYAVTSILSVVLMPQGMGGWFYLLFFGYYPIIKEKTERLKKPISVILKILIFNGALISGVAISYFLFFAQREGVNALDAVILFFGGEGAGKIMAAFMYLLSNVVFLLYDLAVTRMISFYFIKLRHRLKFLR